MTRDTSVPTLVEDEALNTAIAGIPVRVLLALSVALAIWFAFFGTGRSLTLDECHTVWVGRHSVGEIAAYLQRDSGPPLHYFLLSGWIRLFGTSEAAVRGMSAIFYLLGIAVVYSLGRALRLGAKGAFVCSFLYLISPQAIRHAQNARPYALLALLVTLSLFFFVKAFLEAPADPRRRLVLYLLHVACNIAGTFTHYWFFFVLAGQAMAYLIVGPRKRFGWFFLVGLLSVAPFAFLWGPTFLAQMPNGSMSWLFRPGVSALSDTILGFYGQGASGAVVYVLFAGMLVLDFRGRRILFRWPQKLEQFFRQRWAGALLIVCALSLLIPFLLSQWKPIYLAGRYTIVAFPPFAVLLGAIIARHASERLLMCSFCLLVIAFSIGFSHYVTSSPKEDNRFAVSQIQSRVSPQDVIIYTSLSRLPVQYYLERLNSPVPVMQITFPAELDAHPGWIDSGRMLRHRESLEREADEVINSLDSVLQARHGRIWLFYGYDTEVSDVLKAKIERHFQLRARVAVRGSLYNTILLYESGKS